MRRISPDSLLTICRVSVSHRTGSVRRSSNPSSVARYASLMKEKPLAWSTNSPPVKAQPRASRYGSRYDTGIARSRPLSRRPMIVRCDQGQARLA